MAAGVYVAGLLVALEPDLPLVMLAVFGGLAAAFAPSRPRGAISSPLVIAGLAFVVSTGVSSAASADVWRSLRLSTPLLPGAFLLLLIAAYFEGERDLRFLYLVCSAVGLALAATILVAAWRWGAMEPLRLVDALGSPLLVVPNRGRAAIHVLPGGLCGIAAGRLSAARRPPQVGPSPGRQDLGGRRRARLAMDGG